MPGESEQKKGAPAPRTVLICHEDDPLNRAGLARWLASFTDLRAVVEIRENGAALRRRVKREIARVGPWRFLDVAAFRLYQRLALSGPDRRWAAELLETLEARYPPIPAATRTLATASPNSVEAEELIRQEQPDLMLARCKHILKERIFGQARVGTFVMHPGICPEYRNAHGCFWALATRDTGKVGMTLLRVDAGVDTGPVFGYYSCDYDEVRESHNVIQTRVVFDNLDALERKLKEILAGGAAPLDTSGRQSRAWGQPQLSRYLRWKWLAKRERRTG